jgi:hypothetical protein
MGKCVFDGDMGRSIVILKNEVISDQVRDWGVPFDVVWLSSTKRDIAAATNALVVLPQLKSVDGVTGVSGKVAMP